MAAITNRTFSKTDVTRATLSRNSCSATKLHVWHRCYSGDDILASSLVLVVSVLQIEIVKLNPRAERRRKDDNFTICALSLWRRVVKGEKWREAMFDYATYRSCNMRSCVRRFCRCDKVARQIRAIKSQPWHRSTSHVRFCHATLSRSFIARQNRKCDTSSCATF